MADFGLWGIFGGMSDFAHCLLVADLKIKSRRDSLDSK